MGITFDSADGARRYGFDCDVVPGSPAFVGCVVSRHTEADVRVMSDVWTDRYVATVWDDVAGCARKVVLGFAEFYENVYPCEVDATPEVLAAYSAWVNVQADLAAKAAAESKAAADKAREEEARKEVLRHIVKGVRVMVTRGRKTPLGTEGIVGWIGQDSYGTARVGVRDAAGVMHFTAMSNVDRCDMPELEKKAAEVGGWLRLRYDMTLA